MTKRKMLAAEEDIANRVVEMAKRKGSTVFQTVNDILEQALRADGMGLTLDEILERRGMLERAREVGLTFTPERLLYEVVDVAYGRSRKRLSQMWLEAGRWYGKFFAGRSEDGVGAFEEAMGLLTFGSSEFALEEERGAIAVACVGERFSPGFTEVFSLFIEGAFEAFGYRRVAREVSKGIIHLRFEGSG